MERREDELQARGGNTDSAVFDLEEVELVATSLGPQCDTSPRRELERIAQQIDQDLTQLARVAEHAAAPQRTYLDPKLEALLAALAGAQPADFFEQRPEIELAHE